MTSPLLTGTATLFKAELSRLRRSKRFVSWGRSRELSDELLDLLAMLDAPDIDPRTGVQLTVSFFKADAAIFGRADDSNGSIGQVFRVDAAERFAHFAARCDDKAWITKTVLGLLAKNGYGARDTVVEHAKTYLPEQWMRTLADRCWELGSVPSVAADRFDLSRSLWLSVVTDIAEQLNDPQLYERARTARDPDLGVAARIDIARVWNNAGDSQAALQWLDSVPQGERYMQYERDVELARAYQLLGRKSDLEQLLWRRFRDQPSVHTLRALVDVIGEEQRATAIADAVALIRSGVPFDPLQVEFLLDCGLVADAASYVVQRRAQLNGDYWDSLLPLADGLTAGGQPLAATLLYRALLDSILARAVSKAYAHGAWQLKRLGQLAHQIDDWRGIPDHAAYEAAVREQHGRKKSFWTRVGE